MFSPWMQPLLLARCGAEDFHLAPGAVEAWTKATPLGFDRLLQDQALLPEGLLATVLAHSWTLVTT